jgi:hypothetical protein
MPNRIAGTGIDMDQRIPLILMHLKPPPARIAFLLFEGQVGKARLQFTRIREDKGRIREHDRILAEHARLVAEGRDPMSLPVSNQEMSEAMTALFADIHFLLICLSAVDHLLRTLERLLPKNQELLLVRRRHAGSLKKWSDFRNHLEHIDDRVRRGVSDLGNLGNNIFTFDGQSLGVGPDCEKEIEDILDETLTALENSQIET